MNNSKLRILFIAESATLAHIARPFLLAESLDRDEFDVHFASDSYFEFVFRDTHLTTHQIRSRSPQKFQSILENRGILFDAQLLREYVQTELELFRKVQPDIIVGDLRPSLAVSAPLAQLPYIALTNGYWSPHSAKKGLPALFSSKVRSLNWFQPLARRVLKSEYRHFQNILPFVYAAQAKGLDDVRSEYGLPKFSDYLTGFTWGDFTLFSDSPGLVQLELLPSNHRFIGPVSWSPRISSPSWYHSLPGDRLLIYLCLGSSGPAFLLPEIVRALSRFDANVMIASAGASMPTNLPANFFVAPYLPGEQVLQKTSVAITNGGSPSTYQALAAGVPVLGLPTNMDQLLCMSHVEETGACISLRSDLAREGNIRRAVEKLCFEQSYRKNAVALSSETRKFASENYFAQTVNDIALRLRKKVGNL